MAVLDRTVEGAPAGSRGFVCDISDDRQVESAVAEAADHFGRIDVLVNNAGISATGDVTANSTAEWLRVLDVNAVAPGTADTPWVARLLAAADDPDAAAHQLQSRQPMGRLVSASEVAHAIAYLASPDSASTTGTILNVDGGMTNIRV